MKTNNLTISMKIMIIFALIILTIIFLYGFIFEPRHVRLTTVTIHNKTMASTFNGLKIVQLSDLHIGDTWPSAVSRALNIINELKPDLIFLTGDYVTWHGEKSAYDKTFDFLSHLKAPLGVFAVMGDADYTFSRKSCEFCHQKGTSLPNTQHTVKFLRDKKILLKVDDMKFAIIGMERDSISDVVAKLRTDIPTILICHTSLVYKAIDANKNVLVLSGDTHGGQIYLPGFIWNILYRKPDPEHMYGLYQEKNKSLYVTSGIGTSDIPFRLGVPPEVVLFEFKE